MKAYSGSTSEGFLPSALPAAGTAATAVAPAPEDPSATFADALEQQTPRASAFAAWPPTVATSPGDVLPATPVAIPAGSVAAVTSAAPATALVPTDAASLSFTATGTSEYAPATAAPNAGPLPPARWLGPLTLGAPSSSVTTGDSEPTQLPTFAATPLFTALAKPATATAPIPSAAARFSLSDDASETDLPAGTTHSPAATPAPFGAPLRAAASSLSSMWFGPRATTASTPAATATTSSPSESSDDAGAALPRPLPFSSAPWSAASFTTGTPVTATATAKLAQPADADFTGAAIVASVFGRALAPATPAPSSAPAAAAPLTGSPLATIMAHAAILAATAKNGTAGSSAATTPASSSSVTLGAAATASLGRATIAVSAKPGSSPATVEKKSASTSSQRSFLQESGTVPPPADTVATLLQAALAAVSNTSENQTVTTSSSTASSLSGRLASAPISAAGMTNDKKVADMNATPELTSLVVSSGTHPLVTTTSADLHIALGTNHDFTDALHQVMHVAELGNMSRATPPLRVAIEIQTPPGAIVNVYVSRQADSSYRAQLSTNDPQALAWVQDQIGSLKDTTDTGSAIRWSPAQLEPGTPSLSTSSSSTGGDRGYEWDRQQGQSGYQQDERNNRRRPTFMTDEPEAAFETFSTVGGAA